MVALPGRSSALLVQPSAVGVKTSALPFTSSNRAMMSRLRLTVTPSID